MSTMWEKFQGAATTLARSGPMKDRLSAAYRNHLATIVEEDLPREIREPFHQVRCCLTCEQPNRGEDAIRASVRKMSSHEAEHIAEILVQMMSVVARTPQAWRPMQSVPPLYVIEA